LSEVLKEKEYAKVEPIIYVIQEKGSISPKEAELKCNKSSATTRRYMKILVETGYVTQ
jgi:DeoR/GlpR family transcriptional regulator of sugar metabolism